MNWKEEPKAIKKALQDAGFTILHATKGKGTARCWNHITIDQRAGETWQETYSKANEIGERVCGHDKVNINVK